MLNWLRDKLFGTPNSRSESRSSQHSDHNFKRLPPHTTMLSATYQVKEKILLNVIHDCEIWSINVDDNHLISDIMRLSLTHFLEPIESYSVVPDYRFISISGGKVLNPQSTVQDENLKNNDEILLFKSISTGATMPLNLTKKDICGPNKTEILAATANLPVKNPVKLVPALDCQENFQSEIKKVLYSLVEASAKILSQNPDAKAIFDGIAARINAKNKKEIDSNAVKYLKDLGFTETQARYALRLKRNRQVEAMEWLLENSHRVKEDVKEEDVPVTTTDPGPSQVHNEDPLVTIHNVLRDIREFHLRHFEPSARAMETLTSMGFAPEDAIEALKLTSNSQVSAVEWLCGDKEAALSDTSPGLDTKGPLYQALINNPGIQLGLANPKIMMAFLSILENPTSANLWLNDVDTAPVLGQVFKTYHSEKRVMVVNQNMELVQQTQNNQI